MAKFSLDDADARFFQGQVGEHVHDFCLVTDGPDCECCQYRAIIGMAKCECGKVLGPTSVEARLNLWERQDDDLSKLPTQQKLTEEDMNDSQSS